jgi:hypothetical protein
MKNFNQPPSPQFSRKTRQVAEFVQAFNLIFPPFGSSSAG